MENRPDKPGCYWWEDNYGEKHVTEFDEDLETRYNEIFMSPCSFERAADYFNRWLGAATPPDEIRKRVRDDFTDDFTDDGGPSDSCDTCRWENRDADQEPCSVCQSILLSEWQPKE